MGELTETELSLLDSTPVISLEFTVDLTVSSQSVFDPV